MENGTGLTNPSDDSHKKDDISMFLQPTCSECMVDMYRCTSTDSSAERTKPAPHAFSNENHSAEPIVYGFISLSVKQEVKFPAYKGVGFLQNGLVVLWVRHRH